MSLYIGGMGFVGLLATQNCSNRAIEGCAIDIVAPQDLIGTFGNHLPGLEPSFAIWKSVCKESGFMLWVNVETFERTGIGSAHDIAPAEYRRLAVQLDNAARFGEKAIAWELPYLFSPLAGERGPALRDSYLKQHKINPSVDQFALTQPVRTSVLYIAPHFRPTISARDRFVRSAGEPPLDPVQTLAKQEKIGMFEPKIILPVPKRRQITHDDAGGVFGSPARRAKARPAQRLLPLRLGCQRTARYSSWISRSS